MWESRGGGWREMISSVPPEAVCRSLAKDAWALRRDMLYFSESPLMLLGLHFNLSSSGEPFERHAADENSCNGAAKQGIEQKISSSREALSLSVAVVDPLGFISLLPVWLLTTTQHRPIRGRNFMEHKYRNITDRTDILIGVLRRLQLLDDRMRTAQIHCCGVGRLLTRKSRRPSPSASNTRYNLAATFVPRGPVNLGQFSNRTKRSISPVLVVSGTASSSKRSRSARSGAAEHDCLLDDVSLLRDVDVLPMSANRIHERYGSSLGAFSKESRRQERSVTLLTFLRTLPCTLCAL